MRCWKKPTAYWAILAAGELRCDTAEVKKTLINIE